MKKNKGKEIFSVFAVMAIGSALGSGLAKCTAYDGPELTGIHVSAAERESDILELTKKERREIARLVYKEAGAESELGQRLVIDTIFNRMDSENFPDTIHDVIWQSGQFAAEASLDCPVESDILDLIDEEAEDRTNYEVVFFNSVGFTRYGEALFKEGGHYFSKEKE